MPADTHPIGAHVGREEDPLGAAQARGADCAQVFLGDPQGWKLDKEHAGAQAVVAAGVPLYVHAPYGINVASANNRIRIPSRKLLAQTCAEAHRIGATAVIVHGGHVTADDDLTEGFARWRKALEQVASPLPLYLENTAGGNHAMARHLDTLARLWDHVGDLGLGFCLDTCHAHAAGEDFDGLVDRVMAITGRIDLVHANDSKDPAGSGRDRHENLGDGQLGLDAVAEVCGAAGAPAVCETPGGPDGQGTDIERLRARLK